MVNTKVQAVGAGLGIVALSAAAVLIMAPMLKGCRKEVSNTAGTPASAIATNKFRIVTTPEKDTNAPTAYRTDWNIKGTKLGEVSDRKARYELDNIVLAGHRYISARNDAPFARTNELNVRFFDPTRTTLVYDRENKVVTPKSDGFYIPQAATKTNGTLFHRLNVTLPASEKHKYSGLGTDSIDLGTVTTTAEDVPFRFPTVKLNDGVFGEFYACDVGTNQARADRLDKCFVPVPETLIEAHPRENKFTLESPNGIYFLNWVTEDSYRARTNQPRTSIPSALAPAPQVQSYE